MLFYSRNCWLLNWAQFALHINIDCMYIDYLWLQLWLKNRWKTQDTIPYFSYHFYCFLIITIVSVIIVFLLWVCLHSQRNSNWTSPSTHSYNQPVIEYRNITWRLANIAPIFKKVNTTWQKRTAQYHSLIYAAKSWNMSIVTTYTYLQHGFRIG